MINQIVPNRKRRIAKSATGVGNRRRIRDVSKMKKEMNQDQDWSVPKEGQDVKEDP